jgi:hypothetical protein
MLLDQGTPELARGTGRRQYVERVGGLMERSRRIERLSATAWADYAWLLGTFLLLAGLVGSLVRQHVWVLVALAGAVMLGIIVVGFLSRGFLGRARPRRANVLGPSSLIDLSHGPAGDYRPGGPQECGGGRGAAHAV